MTRTSTRTDSAPIGRRTLLGMAGAGVAIGPALAAGSMPPPPVPQSGYPALSKASVGYRDVPWHGEVCGACVWFRPPDHNVKYSHCKLVAGPISPAGWCQTWTAR